MQMRVGEEGVFDISVYRRRFDYCNRGEGIFAHAKYRRKRGPAYIAFFLFFFFSMADQRFRGIPPISSPSSTHDSRANKFRRPFLYKGSLLFARRKRIFEVWNWN